jgi:hypothetical protein
VPALLRAVVSRLGRMNLAPRRQRAAAAVKEVAAQAAVKAMAPKPAAASGRWKEP